MKKIILMVSLSSVISSCAAKDETIAKQQATLLPQQVPVVAIKRPVSSAEALPAKPPSGSTQMAQVYKTGRPSPARPIGKKPALTELKKKHHGESSTSPTTTIQVPETIDSQGRTAPDYESSNVSVHTAVDADPEAVAFYPTALVAKNQVLTYIAGTPVVSSPYLGSRPAFDGSDYIVNISSINRDIRLMQQRRSLGRAYAKLGYKPPERPILALSGAVVPMGTVGHPYFGATSADWNLGMDELDLAAIINTKVEAYMALAYNAAPPAGGGPRVANSNISLNMGFINIGDLDTSPFYLTAGQLYAPFGRFSTSMISPTLPLILTRIKARPFILGYKSVNDTGLFAAIYGYRGETTMGSSGVGGINVGYIIDAFHTTSEIGFSFVSSVNDAGGLQNNGAQAGTTFGGFGSPTNGSESVHKIPAMGGHYAISFDRYNITLEWVSSTRRFYESDLSFNGLGAQPQALQAEGGVTFVSFKKPSSVAASYQWSKDALALNLPHQRFNAVYNISLWKDTVESLEYRHDIDYGVSQYANGAAPADVVNETTYGTGKAADTVMLQIGIYF